MVDKTLKIGSPAQRNVSFQSKEITEDERIIYGKIKEVVGNEHDDCRIWKEIRLYTQGDNEHRATTIVNLLIDAVQEAQTSNSIVEKPYGPRSRQDYPDDVSTRANESMEIESCPQNVMSSSYSVPNTSINSTHDREESDLQKALQESLKVSNVLSSYESSLPEDLESVIRNPNLSTGLHNAGNTCWFNCVAQILYHLPMFRKIIFECVPDSWDRADDRSVCPNTVNVQDFVIVLRKLFAEMCFSTVSYIDTNVVLKVVDALTRKYGDGVTVLGHQQDATESLIRIIDWLEKGIRLGLKEIKNPTQPQETDEISYIPANSTSSAPNSDIAGTAPPLYQAEGYSVVSSIQREQESRPNSPIKPSDIRLQFQEKMKKAAILEANKAVTDEPMDMSTEKTVKVEKNERNRRDDFISPKPPLAKRERIEDGSENMVEDSNANAKEAVLQEQEMNSQPVVESKVEEVEEPRNNQKHEDLEKRLDDLFAGAFCVVTRSEGSDPLQGISVPCCPQYFHLQVSYGNLHDALEASSFDYSTDTGTCRENWYETLPAAIFMGLSRFSYVFDTPEKLHNRFFFPKVLYMDRYMKKNAKKVLELRKLQKSMREKLSNTRAQLNGICKLCEYAGKEDGMRVVDLLASTVNLLSNNSKDNTLDRPSYDSNEPSSSSKSSVIKKSFVEVLPKQAVTNTFYVIPSEPHVFPEFPTFSDQEYPSLSQCLDTLRVIKETIERQENALNEEEARLVNSLENLYEMEELREHEYTLHAIIIHSGEANRGHYWTYSRARNATQAEMWEKLNDKNIEVVPWEKVERDAFGDDTASSPSAYCLIYVRADAKWLFEPDLLTLDESVLQLPNDLKEMVVNERIAFTERIDRFREEKEQKKINEGQKKERSWTENHEANARRGMSGSGRNDENANPSAELSLTENIVLPLDKHHNFLDDDAVAELKCSTDRLFATIAVTARLTFKTSAQVLDYWLIHLMKSYGSRYLLATLDEVSGFKRENEVMSDYTNEVLNSAYDTFIENFIPSLGGETDPTCNLIVFLRKSVSTLNPWVYRYLLVKALSLGDDKSVFTVRAKMELAACGKQSQQSLQNVHTMATWCGLLYEHLNIMTFMCAEALDIYIKHEKESDKLKSIEYMFGAVEKAKSVRYTYNVFKNELFLADRRSFDEVNTINLSYVQLATLLPLSALLKSVVHLVTNKGRKLSEITFIDFNERHIDATEVFIEMADAMVALRKWEATKVGEDRETFKWVVEFNEKSVSLWEAIANLEVPNQDKQKKNHINKIMDVYRNDTERFEACPVIYYESKGVSAENSKMRECFDQLTQSSVNYIENAFEEACNSISQSVN